MSTRPPSSTRNYALFPYTTPFRSRAPRPEAGPAAPGPPPAPALLPPIGAKRAGFSTRGSRRRQKPRSRRSAGAGPGSCPTARGREARSRLGGRVDEGPPLRARGPPTPAAPQPPAPVTGEAPCAPENADSTTAAARGAKEGA